MPHRFEPIEVVEGVSYTTTILNTNFTNIAAQIDNCLYRLESLPNSMLSDLDMNNNDLLNVGSITGIIGVAAFDVSFDNSTSGLIAGNVQGAMDEMVQEYRGHSPFSTVFDYSVSGSWTVTAANWDFEGTITPRSAEGGARALGKITLQDGGVPSGGSNGDMTLIYTS